MRNPYEDNCLQELVCVERNGQSIQDYMKMMGIRVNEYLCILLLKPTVRIIKKASLLINSKVKRCVPCTWYNYPITAWISIHTIYQQHSNENESRADLCVHESEKTCKDSGCKGKAEQKIRILFILYKKIWELAFWQKEWCWS